jgi:hypothetical protein
MSGTEDGRVPAAPGSREPSREGGSAASGFDPSRIMQEFYCSRYYEPKAARPADNVQAAIEMALDRYAGPRIADLELALGLALDWLIQYEPGDSRAVSNEFVAMASILAGIPDRIDECRKIIRDARDSDGSPKGEDALAASSETTARAGTASPNPSPVDPLSSRQSKEPRHAE